jgi:hypothetical protein
MSRIIRAEALFASSLRPSDQPDRSQVDAAIAASLSRFGPGGCVCAMAQEFGEHPDTAAARMRWALTMVDAA